MAETGNRGPRYGRPQPSFSRPMRRTYDAPGIDPADRQRLAELEQEEPLSFAEALDKAAERVRRVGTAIERTDKPDPNIHIAALQRLSLPELIEIAEEEN